MDTSTPGQNPNPANTPGTSIPISNGFGASTPPVAPTFDSLPSVTEVTPDVNAPKPLTPSSPLSPMSPLPPETPFAAPPPEPELTIKKDKGGLKKALPWIIAVLLAAVAGGGVYLWQSQQLSAVKTDAAKDKDTLSKRVAALQVQVDETTASTSTEPEPKPAASTSDQDQIRAVLTADCNAEVALKMFEVKDIKIEGLFATAKNGCDIKTRATTRFNTATLKKVGEIWVIVDAGSTPPTAAERAKYGIPATLYD